MQPYGGHACTPMPCKRLVTLHVLRFQSAQLGGFQLAEACPACMRPEGGGAKHARWVKQGAVRDSQRSTCMQAWGKRCCEDEAGDKGSKMKGDTFHRLVGSVYRLRVMCIR